MKDPVFWPVGTIITHTPSHRLTSALDVRVTRHFWEISVKDMFHRRPVDSVDWERFLQPANWDLSTVPDSTWAFLVQESSRAF